MRRFPEDRGKAISAAAREPELLHERMARSDHELEVIDQDGKSLGSINKERALAGIKTTHPDEILTARDLLSPVTSDSLPATLRRSSLWGEPRLSAFELAIADPAGVSTRRSAASILWMRSSRSRVADRQPERRKVSARSYSVSEPFAAVRVQFVHRDIRDPGAETMTSIDSSKIAEHMDVIAADGENIGKVDHMQGNRIKLTKTSSPDGRHHFVPLDWIDRIDQHVHLTKTLADIRAQAQPHS